MDKIRDSWDYTEQARQLMNNNLPLKAIQKFKRSFTINPNSFTGYFYWGNTLLGLGRYKEAIKSYSKAVIIYPEFTSAYIHWGNAAFLSGDWSEAIKSYKKGIELDPENSLAYNNWGFALFCQKHYQDALHKYFKAAHLDPDQNLTYFNLSLLLFHLGNPEEAMEVFQKGLAQTPHGHYTLKDLLGIYSEQVEYNRKELLEPADLEQTNFLKSKLAATNKIISLLKQGLPNQLDVGDSIGNSDVYIFEKNKCSNTIDVVGIHLVLRKFLLLEYYVCVYEQLMWVFEKIFIFEGSTITGLRDEEFVNIIMAISRILNVNGSNFMATLSPNVQKGVENSIKKKNCYIVLEDEVATFLNVFKNLEELKHFVHFLVLKITNLNASAIKKTGFVNQYLTAVVNRESKIIGYKNPITITQLKAVLNCNVLILVCLFDLEEVKTLETQDSLRGKLEKFCIRVSKFIA